MVAEAAAALNIAPAINTVPAIDTTMDLEVVGQNLLEKITRGITTFAQRNPEENSDIITDVSNYWHKAFADSAPVVSYVIADTQYKNPSFKVTTELAEVITFAAAAHIYQKRRSSDVLQFVEHQHHGVALPVLAFFTQHQLDLNFGVNTHLATALAYLHDVREDWARKFAGKENDHYDLSADLKVRNISPQFVVADRFMKFWLEEGWGHNPLVALLTRSQGNHPNSIELLTVDPALKALMNETNDLEVTRQWQRNAVQMRLLHIMVKLYDIKNNTDGQDQRDTKTAQRFLILCALDNQIKNIEMPQTVQQSIDTEFKYILNSYVTGDAKPHYTRLLQAKRALAHKINKLILEYDDMYNQNGKNFRKSITFSEAETALTSTLFYYDTILQFLDKALQDFYALYLAVFNTTCPLVNAKRRRQYVEDALQSA